MHSGDETLYEIASGLTLVGGNNDTPVALWEPQSGRRIKLGRLTLALIELFRIPRSVASARQSLKSSFPGLDDDTFDEGFAALLEACTLRVYSPNAVRTPNSRGGMFNSPVLSIAEAFSGDVGEVIFLGAPYDLGVTNRPGARAAPAWLRKASGSLYQYPQVAARPQGLWDPVLSTRRLAGVRMADLGDLVATVHHRNGEIFDVLEDIVARAVEARRLPVVLGGDHSLTLAIARGASEAGPIGIVQFDAHDDLATSTPGDWRSQCHHGNFMSWVLAEDRVAHVVQIGIRQRTAEMPVRDPKLKVLPGRMIEKLPIEEVLAELPDDVPWHITIDVDALDPMYLRSTGTPLPGGLHPEKLSKAIEAICKDRRIVALDVMELIPDPNSDADALLIADILLRAIDAATRP